MRVYEAMAALAADLRAEISRPVTTDPTTTTQSPCVLVDLPRLDVTTSTLCGEDVWVFTLLLIGQPGGWPELRPLSDLLDETLSALDRLDVGIQSVQPAAYVPLGDNLTSEPSQAYQIQIERYL